MPSVRRFSDHNNQETSSPKQPSSLASSSPSSSKRVVNEVHVTKDKGIKQKVTQIAGGKISNIEVKRRIHNIPTPSPSPGNF